MLNHPSLRRQLREILARLIEIASSPLFLVGILGIRLLLDHFATLTPLKVLYHSLLLLGSVVLSFLLMEFTRDLWHYLGHKNKLIWELFHKWHHIVFAENWRIKSPELWRKNLLRNGVSEAVVMLTTTSLLSIILWKVCAFYMAVGSLYGVLKPAKTLISLIIRLISGESHPKVDRLHTYAGKYPKPASTSFWVDQPYHHPHHYGYAYVSISSVVKLFDPIFGFARSYERKNIVINAKFSLASALKVEFNKFKARRIMLLEKETQLAKIDVLVLEANSKDTLTLIRQFFATIHSNNDVCNKELWLIVPWGMKLSDELDNIEENAPIIVRKLYLTQRLSSKISAKIALLSAVRDIRKMVI